MRVQAQYEKPYKKKLKKIFEQQEADALDSLAAHASDFTPNTTKDFNVFDDAVYDELMRSTLSPVLEDLAGVQGGLAMTFAGDEDNEFLLTAPMRDIISRATKKMAQTVNDRTLEVLNQTLAEGVTAGEGLSKLQGRVREVFTDLKGYRANLIARTETLKSSNLSNEWAYQQTGFVTGKEWVANPGACEICEEINGKQMDLGVAFLNVGDTLDYGDGESYAVDYETVEDPPLHPNCRCTIIPIR